MLCPQCQVPLSITERQGIEIDWCNQCRGVWLDRGELDKLIERSHQSMAAPLGRSEHDRPRADRHDDDDNRRHRESASPWESRSEVWGRRFELDEPPGDVLAGGGTCARRADAPHPHQAVE